MDRFHFRLIHGLLLVLSLLVVPAPARAQDFIVVASAKGGVSSMTAKQASDVFLGRAKSLPGGTAAAPVDLPPDSPVRVTFTKTVHGRAVAAVQAYWRQQVFSGKGAPPDEVAGDAEMLRAILAREGGIGYVSAGATLPEGVVRVTITG